MARIKKVFGNGDQVIHLWANQSQTEARSTNVFFNGASAYSYGSHYELGRLIKVKGHTVALINNRGYSVTTAKHISWAWGACSHMIRIKSSSFNWLQGLKDESANIKGELAALLRRRTFWSSSISSETINEYLGNDSYLGGRINEFNKTAKLLGKASLCVKVTASYKRQLQAHIESRLKREAELKSPEHIKAKAEKAVKKAEKDITAWRQGGTLTNALRSLKPMLIRVQGDSVQTSSGAHVPLNEALELFKRISCGLPVDDDAMGSFKVDTVRNGEIKIGCHTFALSEVQSVLGGMVQPLRLVAS